MSGTICALAIIAEICFEEDEKIKRRKRKMWMKKWFQERNKYSNMKLLKELKTSSPEDFKNFMRMNDEVFQDLLDKVKPYITKQDTFMREAIKPEIRLSITLRYLANGNSFEDLKFFNAVSPQCIGRIVIETCEAISKVLRSYIKIPGTSSEWKTEAENFQRKSGFPHCIGSIDGKHVQIKKPAKSGSLYFNYKKNFSIILMAVVNAESEFLMVDVGVNGRISDGGVFSDTTFSHRLKNKELNIPDAELIHSTSHILPYVFVGDDAFALDENLMKPFKGIDLTEQEEIFNKTLSSARVKVENAFGILAARFRVLLTTIALCPEKATKIVLACCYLHNYLKKKRGVIYSTIVSSESVQNLENIQSLPSRNSTTLAKNTRKNFCEVLKILNNSQ